MDVKSTEARLIKGLARTAQLDNPALRRVAFDMDMKDNSAEKTALNISVVLDKCFDGRSNSESVQDAEFTEVRTYLCASRCRGRKSTTAVSNTVYRTRGRTTKAHLAGAIPAPGNSGAGPSRQSSVC